jgi:hypothetical protein
MPGRPHWRSNSRRPWLLLKLLVRLRLKLQLRLQLHSFVADQERLQTDQQQYLAVDCVVPLLLHKEFVKVSNTPVAMAAAQAAATINGQSPAECAIMAEDGTTYLNGHRKDRKAVVCEWFDSKFPAGDSERERRETARKAKYNALRSCRRAKKRPTGAAGGTG